MAQPLKQRVADIMDKSWISTRRQLMFYLFCCIGILLNYFLNSLVVNIYHALTEPDNNYEVALRKCNRHILWLVNGVSFWHSSALALPQLDGQGHDVSLLPSASAARELQPLHLRHG